jgi:hypothetical protein
VCTHLAAAIRVRQRASVRLRHTAASGSTSSHEHQPTGVGVTAGGRDLYPSLMRVYAHGVAVEAADPWDPGDLHLIATTDLPVYSSFLMTVVDSSGRSLNERIVSLDRAAGPRRAADYFEERDVRYGLLASAYHLTRLATLYIEVAQLFESHRSGPSTRKGNTYSPPIYYEADAFLTVARRWYESLLHLLWKHFGSDTRPRTFPMLFERQHHLPNEYVDMLRGSWDSHGSSLNAYRNCLIHHDPLDDGGKTAWTQRFSGRWGTTVRLPANPRSQRRAAFDFDNGPDVLDYAHGLLCHLVEVAEATDVLPEIVAYRSRPYPATP